MKTATIIRAIETLERARIALCNGASIGEQVRMSSDCHTAAFVLRTELEAEHPDVTVTK